jgi:hypothetical protein
MTIASARRCPGSGHLPSRVTAITRTGIAVRGLCSACRTDRALRGPAHERVLYAHRAPQQQQNPDESNQKE